MEQQPVHDSGGGVGETSTSLLIRLKASDQLAWERLVELYSQLVYLWCRSAGLQAADSADLGQEVFRAVARKIGDFRRERAGDSFRAWLRSITQNKIRDFYKKQGREAVAAGGSDAQQAMLQVPDRDVETGSSVYSAGEDGEARLLFRRAVELIQGEFADRTWEAFWRVTIEDQAPQVVAQDLSISVNAVYLARSRVIRRLRDEFEGLIEI